MKPAERSTASWLFFAICAISWLILSLFVLAPEFGMSDVYLFRDAASNCLLGHGFNTFAVERQTSFQSHFYSSYTPGLQWLYIAFAGVFGNTPRAESSFVLVWTYLLDAIFVFIGLRFTDKGWLRLLFFGLLALLFPIGGLIDIGDRPEYVSLLLLAGLLFLLSRPSSWKEAVLAGIISWSAFMVEPIAGVFSLFLIVGAWFAWITRKSDEEPPAAAISTPKLAGSLIVFTIGVSLVTAIYLHIDPESLNRFKEQARLGGLQRTSESRQGDFDWPPRPDGSAAQLPSTRHGKLWDIEGSLFRSGKETMIQSVGYVLCIILFIGMMLRSRGSLSGRIALVSLGAVCLVMPLVLFPLQGSYRRMAVPIMALALAFNWAGTYKVAVTKHAPALFLVLLFATSAPSAIEGYIVRFSNRNTYREAVAEAAQLRSYLSHNRGAERGVFLVPTSHYYLYKNVVGEMTTPHYLSAGEDPTEVRGVVNCYGGSLYFDPGILPLPDLVRGLPFHRILSKQADVPFSWFSLGQGRNVTWECDIYVR